ncbi:hypothetical protein Ccrd_002275 [Cynara cardunculus var. scolymus]|uniref:Uncharacterized protein n=1 Tax=Cynara cardunculus var. scolymus TaxID=59895 RepID=A0A103XRQ9_CYNCS|nr:hypothetical protein Ccrd_002275 [Cynara cardunculus var. scolymus]
MSFHGCVNSHGKNFHIVHRQGSSWLHFHGSQHQRTNQIGGSEDFLMSKSTLENSWSMESCAH